MAKLIGKLKSEIKDKIGFNNLNENKYNIESIIAFRKRIKDLYDYITTEFKGKNVLVVTHTGVGIYFRCYFEGEPEDNYYSKYKPSNCEVLIYNND